eukprot:455105_1
MKQTLTKISIIPILLGLIIGILNCNHPIVNNELVHRVFSRFKDGIFCLQMVEEDNRMIAYGDLPSKYVQGITLSANDYRLCSNIIIINNKDKSYSGFLRGTIGIGESYFNGYWSYNNKTQDLGNLMSHLFWNILNNASPYTSYLIYFSVNEWKEYFMRINYGKNKINDAQDVCYHYFNQTFFQYMLDDTMTYTSAVYDKSNDLYNAQINKLEILYNKLNLENKKHLQTRNLLEVGSGWGFFPYFMANKSTDTITNNVTGITIATDQFNYYSKINTSDNLHYMLLDYRDILNIYSKEYFDGIVSVGVFEHVHMKGMNKWFEIMYESLKYDSYFVMTTIIATSQFANGIKTYINKENACNSGNYVNKYIFPGTCLLLIDWIRESATKNGLIPLHIEYMGQHYAKTVKDWRINLENNKHKILQQNIVDQTKYMSYQIYLAMAEAAFKIGKNEQVQITFYKPKEDNIHTKPFDLYMNRITVQQTDRIKKK